jgi:hypothetical protein
MLQRVISTLSHLPLGDVWKWPTTYCTVVVDDLMLRSMRIGGYQERFDNGSIHSEAQAVEL